MTLTPNLTPIRWPLAGRVVCRGAKGAMGIWTEVQAVRGRVLRVRPAGASAGRPRSDPGHLRTQRGMAA